MEHGRAKYSIHWRRCTCAHALGFCGCACARACSVYNACVCFVHFRERARARTRAPTYCRHHYHGHTKCTDSTMFEKLCVCMSPPLVGASNKHTCTRACHISVYSGRGDSGWKDERDYDAENSKQQQETSSPKIKQPITATPKHTNIYSARSKNSPAKYQFASISRHGTAAALVHARVMFVHHKHAHHSMYKANFHCAYS